MTINTILLLLLLLLSVLVALFLVYIQYYYKAKSKSKVHLLLAFLRFVAIFGILVLLINPKITHNTFETVKTPLPLIVDNSSSIIELKQNELAVQLYQKISSNKALQEKFDIQSYKFDSEFEQAEQFDFKGHQTNLDQVAKNLKNLYKNRSFPTVILTDGNQTIGNDYIYSFEANNAVYPIVLGDTTTYLDLKVSQLNVNKYAFHKNKFPVEVFLQYAGNKNVTTDVVISQGNTTLHREAITFSKTKKSAVLNVLLPADKVGLQIFKASISSKEAEKNTYNNTKNFAVEVIDQKSEIAIVSAINHPDVGALKRSIETNMQRKVKIVKPNEIGAIKDYNVLILYQPTAAFKAIFDENKLAHINTWIITGLSTDYAFLNQQQNSLEFKMNNQREDYTAAFNGQYNLFATEDIGFENFPPLQNAFGTVKANSKVEVLLFSKVRNIQTESPLLAYTDNQGQRQAFLLGENIWKWRMQSHLDKNSFESFDVFIDKSIQFLSTNNAKKSLIVNFESFYNSGEAITITAQYFNKNYEFDENARLTIVLTNKETKQTKTYDLLKGNGLYKVNLDGLVAGAYNFTVKESTSGSSYSGYFEVLDFDIEKQFVNPDLNKLTQLGQQTKGQHYFANQVDQLIERLIKNEDYKAVQKAIVKKSPLIDTVWLLILIALALTIEWFIRKYNGLL
ncbi:hypothetical protein [Flavobacterium sp. '19STA2R22 D10 B1']|uniref:hypothetical protein n=1 Tax=Flavobacterium aerium TaxID=3037261 RepID=UPI00278BE607|nr:hypothetical protein [Flavobacterium sp. '19STA2R22 D10 B1']